MNARVTLPTPMSQFVFRLILFILLLSALVIILNQPNHLITMHSIMNDSGPFLASASQARPHAVPVPIPPAKTSLHLADATPVPSSNQPIPVPQPVPTPPASH